jgi:hypothetical protein
MDRPEKRALPHSILAEVQRINSRLQSIFLKVQREGGRDHLDRCSGTAVIVNQEHSIGDLAINWGAIAARVLSLEPAKIREFADFLNNWFNALPVVVPEDANARYDPYDPRNDPSEVIPIDDQEEEEPKDSKLDEHEPGKAFLEAIPEGVRLQFEKTIFKQIEDAHKVELEIAERHRISGLQKAECALTMSKPEHLLCEAECPLFTEVTAKFLRLGGTLFTIKIGQTLVDEGLIKITKISDGQRQISVRSKSKTEIIVS